MTVRAAVPGVPHTAELLLPELFWRQVALTPDAVAVSDGAEALSYRETGERVRALAARLSELGVGPEAMVGIQLPRSVRLVVAMLAVATAGGAFLLLDPEHPAERRAGMLGTARALALVCEEPVPGPWSRVRPDEGPVADGPVAAPAELYPDNAAYVAFTSGSTGAPKGVVNTQAGLANRLADAVRRHGVGPGDRLLSATGLGFDPVVFQVFLPLVCGATLVLAPDGLERDPVALVELLREERITALELVPSVLQVLLEQPEAAGVGDLRWLTSAGEMLTGDLCARALSVLGVRVRNVYGPAECAIGVTDHPYDPAQGPGGVPLGGPIDNVRIVLLDEDGHRAESGEIHLGGVCVGRGYLGAPGLTADRFRPDPDGPPGARLYRTGDRARTNLRGELEFAGRIDNQIKLSGVRIEPEGIEALLTAHPLVEAAAVTVAPDRVGGQQLVAFVKGSAGHEELRGHLRAHLPDSHLPSVFQPVDELPLTANGKVDRTALTVDADPRRAPYRAPRTPEEVQVTEIWQEVLGVGRIGLDDNFFQLGGYSLLLLRVAMRLRKLSGLPLQVRELFGAPTPAGQSLLIAGARAQASPVSAVEPVPRDRPLPLSYAQQDLWVLDRMNPGSGEYTMPIMIRLPENGIPTVVVEGALRDLAARHEILRTRYASVNGSLCQIVDKDRPVRPSVVEVTEAQLPEAVRRETAAGFDLAEGPVWRAMLARVSDGTDALLLTFHHIASDGWSMVVLRRELDELISARKDRREPLLPDMSVQYADFAVWQRERVDGGALDEQLAYWRRQLAGLPTLDLPTDRPRPPIRDTRGAAFEFEIPAAVMRPVLEAGWQRGATPYATLLAAYAALLARYCGQGDIPIGTPLAGRLREEVAGVLGCFLNTVVMRCDAAGDPAFTELLERVRQTVSQAQGAQEVPFAHLVRELAPERDQSRNLLAQVLFDLHDDGVTSVDGGRTDTGMLLDAWTGSKADLNLVVQIQPDRSCLAVLEYSTALFDAETVRRLAGHFRQLLAGVAADPQARLHELPLLPPDELRAVLAAGRGADAARPELAVHELFAVQAAKTPDAPALLSDAGGLSYAELADRSDRLASRLRGLGVGPESVVGVCLDRGTDLVVSFLAVWKAGAAYVPLDPDFPAERLRYMLDDSGARCVITDRARAGVLRPAVPLLLDDPGERARLAAQPPFEAAPADLDALAYVIYTSGSTGRPKGVMVDHRGLLNYLMWTVEDYAGSRPGGTPLFSSTAYDMVVPDLYTALVTGEPVRLLPPHFDPSELGRLLAAGAPYSFVKLTPGHLDLLSAQLTPEQAAGLAGVLAVGADSFPVPVLERWLAKAGPDGPRLLNEYGPTEISVANSTYRITGGGHPEVLPIGTPVPNTTMWVLDGHGNPCPVGVPGELHIGGTGVARGYRNRPGLTAAVFVPDPFSAEPGRRLYRTGDRARLLPDGNVEFLGRLDEQIKLRGHRIEPGEITAVLTERPEVADALVRVDTKGATGRLVAWVVPADGHEPVPAELLEHCALRLPAPMVPAALVLLDRIPLNANGKVDHAALPAPPEEAAEHSTGPLSELAEGLAGLWSDLLGYDVLPELHRTFFQLGGDSVLASRLVAAVEADYGVRLPLRSVFEHPTVAGLARLVEERIRADIAEMSDAELTRLTTSDEEDRDEH
ncbi:amino acid adenylation domain-containing protein [Kitasatospora arboriphila]|uniref:Carrier domain-containing protein n=1 Tax=Kitasatospora arboriphila TaxID=258052 RepID=A0ABN1TUH1_9ACTN